MPFFPGSEMFFVFGGCSLPLSFLSPNTGDTVATVCESAAGFEDALAAFPMRQLFLAPT
jgi:hypothetical protein